MDHPAERGVRPRGVPPLVFLAIGFAVGVALGFRFRPGPLDPPGTAVLALFAGILIASLVALLTPWRFCALLAAALFGGGLIGVTAPPDHQEGPFGPAAGEPVAVQGRLAFPPDLLPNNRCRFRLDRARLRRGGRFSPLAGPLVLKRRLPPRTGCPALAAGQWIHTRAVIPATASAPHFGVIPRHLGVVPIGPAPAADPRSLPARLRHRALRRLAPNTGPGRALIAAVTTGDRAWLPRRVNRAFRSTGIAHLLAISGLHVGLVSGLIFLLLRRLFGLLPALGRHLAPVRLAAACSIAATWCFVAFAGAATPACRAGIMATVFLGALLLYRLADSRASLALAALIVLFWDPTQIASPGAQLSFAAVLGLLIVLPGLRPKGDRPGPLRPNVKGRLCSLIWVTLAATLATAPLAALHFGQVTAAGLLTNLVAVPLLGGLILPIGLAGLALALVHPLLGHPLLALAALAARGLIVLVSWAETQLGPLSLAVQPTIIQTGCIYVALAALLLLRSRPHRLGFALLAAALLVGLLETGRHNLGPGGGTALRLTFFDVGLGDSALVTFPDGRHWLVDAPAGQTHPAAADRVARALRRCGVRRLHRVVVSHPHADHCGGLVRILKNMEVDAIIHSGVISATAEWQALVRLARRRRVPLRVPRPGPRRVGDGALVAWLAPIHAGLLQPHPLRSANDNGLVLRLALPGGSVLFTGDLERPGEAALLRAHPPGHLRATVLKVGHHGSRTSTSPALLDAVSPRLAIISAPCHRRLFPHPAVLRRLRRRRIPTLVTGCHGDVTVTIAPWGITVRSPRGRPLRLPPRGRPRDSLGQPDRAALSLSPLDPSPAFGRAR